jgi:hypothetical protein
MAHPIWLHRRGLLFLFYLALLALVAGASGPRPAHAAGDWSFPDRRLRLPLTIGAGPVGRTDKIADVVVDFTPLLAGKGFTQSPFDPGSLRVVEVNGAGQVLNDSVPFQFDPAPGYDATTNARGTLVLLLSGQTAAGSSRRYQVYFDLVGPQYSQAPMTPRLSLTDGVVDSGFAAYRLTTPAATYVYHKQGGGFAHLLDLNGNDWISWNTAKGYAGDYRGIPNLVHPRSGGYFHPGRTTSSSSILNQGPLKVTVKSVSSDKVWETQWEVYPTYARLTVTKAGGRYWFLYEGTPGGELTGSDRVVRANGNETGGFGSFSQDLSGEEWVYFRDPAAAQTLFLVHEQEDTVIDSYQSGDDLMTVFGFGRDIAAAYLNTVPQHFVFGLAPAGDHAAMTAAIHAAYKPLTIAVGPVESDLPDTPGCQGPNEILYFSSMSAGSVGGVAFGDEDVVQYDRATCEWSLAFDGSAAGLPAAADVDGFEVGPDGAFYLSFLQAIPVPGITGKVDDSDVVRYDGESFSLWFDGSQFGLTTDSEDVDAVAFDPEGRLLISTLGGYSVPGLGKGADEDLLRLENQTWALIFDGSHNAGLAAEDIDGAAWLPDGTIWLNLLDAFALGGVRGDGSDILGCSPTSLGALTTTCAYQLVWDAGANGGLSGVNALGFSQGPTP